MKIGKKYNFTTIDITVNQSRVRTSTYAHRFKLPYPISTEGSSYQVKPQNSRGSNSMRGNSKD